ncbi:hypothetical protein F511_31443 [Dorcoceras hygrometricum]|uniref:Uncharacterized protein n=1 Tax=Dorcoceras hygrometricum TaxID=472368 RepID=A0A2Z7B2K0_9LAMI|nr:hypothetical protein F511_31443 [Dorcoceras hygrometricum]
MQTLQSTTCPFECHVLRKPSYTSYTYPSPRFIIHNLKFSPIENMSCLPIASSNFLKKIILIPSSNPPDKFPMKKLATTRYDTRLFRPFSTRLAAYDPYSVPGKSPPEINTPPPVQEPSVTPEVPRTTGVPEFEPIPSENPADPPPLSPGPNPGPEFPGPPNPSPPTPDAPRPPMPSPPGVPEVPVPSPPNEPEVVPPHGPDVVPPMPPEPGPSGPNFPDMPPPIMGSNGLAFY